jgi:hypothetical protein
MGIEIEETEGGFALVRTNADESVNRFPLSSDDLARLAASSPRLVRLALAKQRLGKAPLATIMVPDARAGLNCDIHETAIHLEMLDRQDVSTTYILPLNEAQHLLDSLPRWIARISKPKSKQ